MTASGRLPLGKKTTTITILIGTRGIVTLIVSHLRVRATVRVVFGSQVWDDKAVVAWAVYSRVTEPTQGQLFDLPTVGTLWDAGNDGVGET